MVPRTNDEISKRLTRQLEPFLHDEEMRAEEGKPPRHIHTASALGTFESCQRLYHYRYEEGYREAVEPSYFIIGRAVHKGVECFWLGKSFPDAREEMFKVYAESNNEDKPAGWLVERHRLNAYLKGYYQKWGPSRDDYDVIGVEADFFSRWFSGVSGSCAGKLDTILRRKSDGKLIILDTKTASSRSGAQELASAYWEKLVMDTQIVFYSSIIYEMTGEEPEFIYDVIIKTSANPLKSRARKKNGESEAQFNQRYIAGCESDSEFGKRIAGTYTQRAFGSVKELYIRRSILITSADLFARMEELEAVASDIETADKRAPKGRRNSGQCTRGTSTCAFLSVCTGSMSLDDPKFVKKSTRHEELTIKQEAL